METFSKLFKKEEEFVWMKRQQNNFWINWLQEMEGTSVYKDDLPFSGKLVNRPDLNIFVLQNGAALFILYERAAQLMIPHFSPSLIKACGAW